MKNIVMIGMPGAGKSTIGVILAKELGVSPLEVRLAGEKSVMLMEELHS